MPTVHAMASTLINQDELSPDWGDFGGDNGGIRQEAVQSLGARVGSEVESALS